MVDSVSARLKNARVWKKMHLNIHFYSGMREPLECRSASELQRKHGAEKCQEGFLAFHQNTRKVRKGGRGCNPTHYLRLAAAGGRPRSLPPRLSETCKRVWQRGVSLICSENISEQTRANQKKSGSNSGYS